MDDEGQDKMTVRERRAQRAKTEARKGAPAKVARKMIVPAIVVLVIAAVAAGMYFNERSAGKCPGHWHATFDLILEDGNGTPQRMSFRNGLFDLQYQTPMRAHMHQSDGKNQFHFEQAGTCVGIEEAFGYVDVNLNRNSIELDGAHKGMGQDGKYTPEGNKTIRAFIEHVSDRVKEVRGNREVTVSATTEWRETSLGSVLDYQLKDGERLLILYGEYSDDQVEQYKAAAPKPDTGYPIGG